MIRNINLTFLFAILCLGVISCSKPTIKPADVEINGDLAGAFKIVDEEYPVESSGDKASVTIKVERTDVTVPYIPERVGVIGKETDNDNELMAKCGFSYQLLDAEGKAIEEISASENEANVQVKNILKLAPKSTGEMTVTFNKDLKPASILLSSKSKILSTGPLNFVGAIGRYKVKNFEATFNFATKEEGGKYQYSTSPAGAFLYFKGTNEAEVHNKNTTEPKWSFNMSEQNDKGNWCGAYEGKIVLTRDNPTSPYYYKMTGKFTNFRFDTYPFEISSRPIGSEGIE